MGTTSTPVGPVSSNFFKTNTKYLGAIGNPASFGQKDPIYTKKGIGEYLDPGGFFADTYQDPLQLAGTTTAPPSDASVRNADGTITDPTTGQLYTAQGVAITNPNSAQLVAGGNNTAGNFLNTAAGYGAREQGAYQGQGELAKSYLDTINDPNASSVATQQLHQGLDQINSDQLSAAAGAGGNNGALARMNATRNMQQAGAAANQSEALVRAQEKQAAQTGLGATLSNMAGESEKQYGTDVGAANQFNTTANQTEEDREKTNLTQQQNQRSGKQNIAGKILGSVFSLGA